MADEALMSAAELAQTTGGRLEHPRGAGNAASFSSVAIDSRKVLPGGLFVALPGSERDGHDFLPAAFEAGAAVALVCESRLAVARAAAERSGAAIVVVPDTLKGLQDAAAGYLDRFPHLVRIGITGSTGKTTTKELTAAMIAKEKRVVMNVGNLNSETGLPLSVFSVRRDHEVGVFELGMNRRGEISELAAVLRPSVALITNIGTAHIGILGTKDRIAEEKKAIFSFFSGTELGLVPEDDPYADMLAAGLRGTVRRYGARSLPSFGGAVSRGLEGTEIVWGGVPAVFPLPGAHNLKNALAAAAIAEAVGVSAANVRSALQEAKALFGRAEIFRGDVTVVRDCYNANPESMEAAIEFCDSVEWPGRRVYVVGAMLELGDSAEAEHRRLGERLARSRADIVYLFGRETEAAAEALGRSKAAFRYDDMEALARAIGGVAGKGDLVLLKGSRGTALERLTDLLVPPDKIAAAKGA
jgi:UDP-N-acetylmuramoyl-tripeptide--D-alanyl-D-alanine ligase